MALKCISLCNYLSHFCDYLTTNASSALSVCVGDFSWQHTVCTEVVRHMVLTLYMIVYYDAIIFSLTVLISRLSHCMFMKWSSVCEL